MPSLRIAYFRDGGEKKETGAQNNEKNIYIPYISMASLECTSCDLHITYKRIINKRN